MNLRLKKAPQSLYEIAGVLMMLQGMEGRGMGWFDPIQNPQGC